MGCTMDESELRKSLRKLFDIDNEIYSTRMAFVFGLGLSAFLWWIPIIGPAVSGYVCGRKTGSMMKGFLCSLISGIVLLLIIKLLSLAILGHGGYPGVPADQAVNVFADMGAVGSIARYLQTFFVAGTSTMSCVAMGVTTVFGGVGGIMARQMRKEEEYLMTLGAARDSARQAPRSMQLYNANKEMGFRSFDDCIEAQKMTTNNNTANDKQKAGKVESVKAQRPVATTVQTVTSTVSGNTVPTEAPMQAKAQGSPFTDILERSSHRKDK